MPKIELVPIGSIRKNPKNPRIIKDDKFKKLVKSITDFPEMLFIRPVVIDSENMILGGNMRYEAAKSAGRTDIPIIKADNPTEDQKQEFIIKDNVSGGDWDWAELANEWDVDLLNEWGLDVPMFNNETDVEEDDPDINTENIPCCVVSGDLIEIGCHRLLCGDSTMTDTWARLFDGSMADMVLTDPPYNVDYVGKTKNALTIKNDKKNDSDFYNFLYDYYTAQSTVVKSGGAWYVWHADSEGANFRYAMQNAGIMVKQCLVWVKNCMVIGRQDYQWQHEPCLYGWKEGSSHSWYSDRKQTTVLNFDRPSRSEEHPTMKPVKLFAYQIQNSSKSGDIIADGFLGSGTTMVACNETKRRCYGVELDPKYCQVIINRMLKFDPEIKVKINGLDYNG